MTTYDTYKEARDKSWCFLLESGACALPLPLSAICQKRGITLMLDTKGLYLADSDKGVTFKTPEGKFCILLNPADSIPVRRFTTAHELGHIYLKHPMQGGKYGRTFGIQKTATQVPSEYQAERFAINILAPACVLYGLGLHTAEDIARVCGISLSAARIRAERLAVLYQRKSFFCSPLERKVFELFEDFIKANR